MHSTFNLDAQPSKIVKMLNNNKNTELNKYNIVQHRTKCL